MNTLIGKIAKSCLITQLYRIKNYWDYSYKLRIINTGSTREDLLPEVEIKLKNGILSNV
jgi:hypothetical protein